MALAGLDTKNFAYPEWVALAHARDWALNRGMAEGHNINNEFKKYYSARERARIHKLLRMMLFANYCGNALYKRPWNKGARSCTVNFKKK